mgnify:CR=1 FL=1
MDDRAAICRQFRDCADFTRTEHHHRHFDRLSSPALPAPPWRRHGDVWAYVHSRLSRRAYMGSFQGGALAHCHPIRACSSIARTDCRQRFRSGAQRGSQYLRCHNYRHDRGGRLCHPHQSALDFRRWWPPWASAAGRSRPPTSALPTGASRVLGIIRGIYAASQEPRSKNIECRRNRMSEGSGPPRGGGFVSRCVARVTFTAGSL